MYQLAKQDITSKSFKQVKLTQKPVVLMRLEEFFGSVEKEPEGQEDLDVGSLLEDSFVDGFGILQLVDADGVRSRLVADGVQGVQNLKHILKFNNNLSP